MLHFNFSRKALFSAVAMACILVLSVTGCKDPEPEKNTETEYCYYYVLPLEENDALLGTWEGSYEGEAYKITKDTFNGGSYAGSDIYALKETQTSGRLFFKYTAVYDWNNPLYEKPKDYSEDKYYYSSYTYNETEYKTWYSLDTEQIGKWYCVSYKNLTDTSISLSGAYGKEKSFNTLKDAVANFTVDDGYFSTYSECTKNTASE
jgi:hypothetical protein